MQIRKLALNGAAALALAALTVPALAGESTPAEKVATDQLNQQQLAMANGTVSDSSTIGNSGQTNLDQRTLTAAPGAVVTAATTTNTATPNDSQTMVMADNNASIAAAPISQPANGVVNPAKTFATASVVASGGQMMGAVQKILIGPDGHARTVNVALLDSAGQSKIVSIDATALSYDTARNVLVAQMTNDQIMALPSEPQG